MRLKLKPYLNKHREFVLPGIHKMNSCWGSQYGERKEKKEDNPSPLDA